MSSKNDQFTFREVVENLSAFFKAMVLKWKVFVLAVVLSNIVFIAYNYLKDQNYTATTTFVLQNSESGLNEISSLASLAGVNLGGLAESSDLFQIDNVQELYRSHVMIATTLLSEAEFNGKKDLLVNRYIENRDYRKKWADDDQLSKLVFDPSLYGMARTQDSLLMEFTEEITEDVLNVSKPSRKLSILNVSVKDEDQYFAKAFNEKLVENVNNFYKRTVTKKSGDNLKILQDQTDSVKQVLDDTMLKLAQIQESAPNRNPLYRTSMVEEQKTMIDITASSAIYETVVTNLELAKISHRNKTPLIQIIDRPIMPLKTDRWKLAKTMIIATAIGGLVCFFCLTFLMLYRSAMDESS